jgi:DNA-binding Lrp family transcriptional regulator
MSFQSLSRAELEIVAQLQSNGRTTKRALAERVGLAPSTTLDKVRDLEARGVITGYHAEVALDAMGRSMQAFVAIRISPKTQAIVDSLIERLWQLPETLGVFIVSGDDDVLVHLGVEDTQSLRRLVLDNIANAEGVVDETTSLIFEYRRKHVVVPIE